MGGFGGRLRDALSAAGVSVNELAKVAGVSSSEVEAWLAMDVCTVAAFRLVPVVKRLRVRMYWLACGESVPHLLGTLTPDDQQALEILGALRPPDIASWFAVGYHLVHKGHV